MKYEFGVMSNKWSMDCDDFTQAYIAMSMFIGKNVPVAVFSPQKYGFMPKDILEINMEVFNPKVVKKAIDSIRKVM